MQNVNVPLPMVWSDPMKRKIVTELSLEAAKRFRRFALPESKEEWLRLRPVLRKALLSRIHNGYDRTVPLDVEWRDPVPFDGGRTRRLVYTSRRGIRVTATLYVPDGKGPFPALVYMHGHNADGRLSPLNQSHGYVFAKAGYAVIQPDVFGMGERATEHGKFEYHGGLMGGLLFNLGETPMGCQLCDNMRAVDLLETLDFIDADRIGATGASGGGNQTMYLTAFDERIKAGVPVVSAGSYQSYVGGANCVCELIPDGLDVCEESAVLAFAAPRALLLCNAMHDINPTFYVAEMLRSVRETEKVFRALGCAQNLRTLAFNGPHSYPREVESAAIGFFDFHLKGIGHAFPVPAPQGESRPLEEAMFYSPGKRPADVLSIAGWLARRGTELARTAHGTKEELPEILKIKSETILHTGEYRANSGWTHVTLETSRGRLLPVLFRPGTSGICRILAAPGGKQELARAPFTRDAVESGDAVLIFDPWGCGESGNIPESVNILYEQHCLARALIWLGRRLMGEWTMDYLRAMEYARSVLPDAQFRLYGARDSGPAALYASILAENAPLSVETWRAPRTYVRDADEHNPYPEKISGLEYCPGEFFTMALVLPGILLWGDIPHAVELSPSEVRMTDSRSVSGKA